MKILYNKTNCMWWSVFQVDWYSVFDDQCFKSTSIDTNWDFFLECYDCRLLFDSMQHKLTVTYPCHFGDHDLLVLPWFNCNGWLGIKHQISYFPDLFVLGHQKLMFILFSTHYVFKKKQFICEDKTKQKCLPNFASMIDLSLKWQKHQIPGTETSPLIIFQSSSNDV